MMAANICSGDLEPDGKNCDLVLVYSDDESDIAEDDDFNWVDLDVEHQIEATINSSAFLYCSLDQEAHLTPEGNKGNPSVNCVHSTTPNFSAELPKIHQTIATSATITSLSTNDNNSTATPSASVTATTTSTTSYASTSTTPAASQRTMYIKNLNPTVDSVFLKIVCSPYGDVANVKVIKEADGTSKGFAFVTFKQVEQAKKAICLLNGKELDGRVLFAGPAMKKSSRTNHHNRTSKHNQPQLQQRIFHNDDHTNMEMKEPKDNEPTHTHREQPGQRPHSQRLSQRPDQIPYPRCGYSEEQYATNGTRFLTTHNQMNTDSRIEHTGYSNLTRKRLHPCQKSPERKRRTVSDTGTAEYPSSNLTESPLSTVYKSHFPKILSASKNVMQKDRESFLPSIKQRNPKENLQHHTRHNLQITNSHDNHPLLHKPKLISVDNQLKHFQSRDKKTIESNKPPLPKIKILPNKKIVSKLEFGHQKRVDGKQDIIKESLPHTTRKTRRSLIVEPFSNKLIEPLESQHVRTNCAQDRTRASKVDRHRINEEQVCVGTNQTHSGEQMMSGNIPKLDMYQLTHLHQDVSMSNFSTENDFVSPVNIDIRIARQDGDGVLSPTNAGLDDSHTDDVLNLRHEKIQSPDSNITSANTSQYLSPPRSCLKLDQCTVNNLHTEQHGKTTYQSPKWFTEQNHTGEKIYFYNPDKSHDWSVDSHSLESSNERASNQNIGKFESYQLKDADVGLSEFIPDPSPMSSPTCNTSQGINLYVKHLGDDVDDATLNNIFSKFGDVISAKVMMEADKSRGFGFVCFARAEDAARATRDMRRNVDDVNNLNLYVAPAQRKEERQAFFREKLKSKDSKRHEDKIGLCVTETAVSQTMENMAHQSNLPPSTLNRLNNIMTTQIDELCNSATEEPITQSTLQQTAQSVQDGGRSAREISRKRRKSNLFNLDCFDVDNFRTPLVRPSELQDSLDDKHASDRSIQSHKPHVDLADIYSPDQLSRAEADRLVSTPNGTVDKEHRNILVHQTWENPRVEGYAAETEILPYPSTDVLQSVEIPVSEVNQLNSKKLSPIGSGLVNKSHHRVDQGEGRADPCRIDTEQYSGDFKSDHVDECTFDF